MPSRRHELAGGAASPPGGAEKPKSGRERSDSPPACAMPTDHRSLLSVALLCVFALFSTPGASASVVLTVR